MGENNCSNGHSVVSNGNRMSDSGSLKITAVGDGMVGKTCMLVTYSTNEFPLEYEPTVFDNLPCEVTVDGVTHRATLWDTAGQEDYERLRPLSYPGTGCFILCYSISNKSSFDNIVQKWYPELKQHCPNVPILLVGTKSDLRGTKEEVVTPKMARKVRNKISALKSMECSAMMNDGLDEIFEEAVRLAANKYTIKRKKQWCPCLGFLPNLSGFKY